MAKSRALAFNAVLGAALPAPRDENALQRHEPTQEAPMNALLRTVLIGLGLAAVMLSVRAAGFDLVTADDMRQDALAAAQQRPAPRTRSLQVPRPGQPVIEVLAPAAAAEAVSAPVRIELAFKPAPGARIVPATFRVLYGQLKLDLTERLRPHATITEQGVVVDRAQVPAGQHRLILQVADDQGNAAEQELRLRVGVVS